MVKKSGVEVTVDKLAAVGIAVASLARTRVMVGIPQEDDPRNQGGSIGNAALLYIHEHGAPEVNIPARPTLRPGIAAAQPRILEFLKQAGYYAFEGKMEASERAFSAAGLVGQNSVKAQISNNVPPPLSERTLAARRRQGVTRTNTLIDTAQMQGTVTYVIRRI